jgi:hypothetical protein
MVELWLYSAHVFTAWCLINYVQRKLYFSPFKVDGTYTYSLLWHQEYTRCIFLLQQALLSLISLFWKNKRRFMRWHCSLCVCVSVYPLSLLGNYVPSATNTHATVEELLNGPCIKVKRERERESACVLVCVWRRGPVTEWVPAQVTPSTVAATSTDQILRAVEEEASFKKIKSVGKSKIMAMGPERTRNQDWLCWRVPAAIYRTAQFFPELLVSYVFRLFSSCRHNKPVVFTFKLLFTISVFTKPS